jgi:hypothetical protein
MALFAFQTLGLTAYADEGMWTFNNVPRAEIKKRYGFEVTDAWLKKLQLASVRFNNGGSGSFVSPDGLVLTNYHIVEDIVGELSTPQKDYAKEGFLARTRAEERKGRDGARQRRGQGRDGRRGSFRCAPRRDQQY